MRPYVKHHYNSAMGSTCKITVPSAASVQTVVAWLEGGTIGKDKADGTPAPRALALRSYQEDMEEYATTGWPYLNVSCEHLRPANANYPVGQCGCGLTPR